MRKYTIRQALSALICSLAVLSAGSTYVWINPREGYLLSEESPFNMTKDDISWYGAIVEVGDLAATLPSGYLADKFGRRIVLLTSGPLTAATWLVVQMTTSYGILMITRVVQGLAVGCIFTVTPIYLGEIVEKKYRGLACSLVQIMWYVGMIYQYVAGPYLNYLSGILVVCQAPALVFTILFYFCPETPRYYIINNNFQKAASSMAWLTGQEIEEEQLKGMVSRQEEAESFLQLIVEFFSTRKCLKSLILLSAVTITNVSGVTPILSYSTSTFESITKTDGAVVTIAMGCLSLVTTCIAALNVERLGRRLLLLASLCCCVITLVTGACLQLYIRESIAAVICIALYPSLMSIGPGTLTYALIPELFSDRHRGTGAALVTLITAFATFLGLKFFKVIETAFGLETNLFILTGISIVSGILIYRYLPETKGKTFEEIQDEL